MAKKCSWYKKCLNGGQGCWSAEPKSCVRYLPTEGTNLTEINGVIETPPNIDEDKFSQYFTNWIDSMGWCFCGSFKEYKEENNDES